MLNLPEEFFLLSIDDNKGKIIAEVSDGLELGLAGALLAELALQDRIGLKDKRLVVTNPAPTSDGALDEALEAIGNEKRLRKISWWIERFARRGLADPIAERLVKRNILKIEHKRNLWVIPYEVFPQVDASAKYWVKHHLRRAVLAGGEATPGIIALLSLLKACRLLDLVFTRDEKKVARRKVEALVASEPFGAALAETIEEIEAAMSTVIIVSG